MLNTIDEAIKSKAWPFTEALKILDRLNGKAPKKGYVLFETGYGPSGLPHIGTFGEVARTNMVIQAFRKICDIRTKLICFSDDLDGLRKIPSNVPNQEMLKQYLGMPLTSIPDPFGKAKSYGDYMNLKLQSFLDRFGFDYEFCSATDYYKDGKFDHMMLRVLEKYEEIMEVMLPTFREERKATYSPFMPLCPETGKVLEVPIISINKIEGTVTYKNDSGIDTEVSVTGGRCKLQWKPDFGMRWAALDVDYEIYGKDHMPNGPIYSKICKILNGTPPVQFCYEMFLAQDGAKISKSKGNSISIDDWLTYAPIESMLLFMYQSPNKAKRLYFDVIPKMVDEYLIYNKKYHETEDMSLKFANPAYHIHEGAVPKIETYNLSFSLLLNLASACNPDTKSVLWGFITKYVSHAVVNPYLDQLVEFAIKYYEDFIKANKSYLTPSSNQKAMLQDIANILKQFDSNDTAEDIQSAIYAIGMKYEYENLREYFQDLYQILLGQKEGPRLGSFIKLFGIENMRELISKTIS